MNAVYVVDRHPDHISGEVHAVQMDTGVVVYKVVPRDADPNNYDWQYLHEDSDSDSLYQDLLPMFEAAKNVREVGLFANVETFEQAAALPLGSLIAAPVDIGRGDDESYIFEKVRSDDWAYRDILRRRTYTVSVHEVLGGRLVGLPENK